ncbi:MAG: DUF981 domain-containing protein [Candidatus Thermoplasmatota archaeon]|jgi:putative membrane protein|nr:DUF981 domain-containing protein [Candidatus Thermoplasmatota archaeon]
MVFIDDLAFELFTLSLVGVVSIYLTGYAYLYYRKGLKDVETIMRPGAFILGILGVIIVIMGIFGEMTWPLPGSYNILFYDPYLLFGIILVSVSSSIILKQKLQFSGILALFSGLIAIYYGVNAYLDKMTSSPIAMLGLYLSLGLTGMFTFPATLIYDLLPSRDNVSKFWTVILVLFWVGLIVSSVLAALTAIEAVPQHLLKPP